MKKLLLLTAMAVCVSVVLATPSLPGTFPPPPPWAGHTLIVTKELIEMLALTFIACTTIGRWAGLDFFVHALVTGRCCSSKSKGNTDAS